MAIIKAFTTGIRPVKLYLLRAISMALALLSAPCLSPTANATSLSTDELDAVCSAQKFLATNGYLNEPAASDTRELTLELWDSVTYGKGGGIDWNTLLKRRRGTFSNRLRAVGTRPGGFIVVYGFPSGDSQCVWVDRNRGAIHLNEANCVPKQRTLKLISEAELHCKG